MVAAASLHQATSPVTLESSPLWSLSPLGLGGIRAGFSGYFPSVCARGKEGNQVALVCELEQEDRG